MTVIVEQLVEWRLAGETEVLGENLPLESRVYTGWWLRKLNPNNSASKWRHQLTIFVVQNLSLWDEMSCDLTHAYQSLRNVPISEDNNLHSNHHENLKSDIFIIINISTTIITNTFTSITSRTTTITTRSRDSAISVESGYVLENRGVGVRVLVWSRISSSPSRSDRFWNPPEPPIQWAPGTLSPEVKRPGREDDHSLPTNAKVKKTWIYASTPPYVFMGWCLIS
jgi:hypothetical protein